MTPEERAFRTIHMTVVRYYLPRAIGDQNMKDVDKSLCAIPIITSKEAPLNVLVLVYVETVVCGSSTRKRLHGNEHLKLSFLLCRVHCTDRVD